MRAGANARKMRVNVDKLFAVSTPIQLLEGERQLGQYQVQIARQTSSGWAAAALPLSAVVSNARLILQPITRKPYPIASIPSHYIVKVYLETFGQRSGITVGLKNDYLVNLFVSWGQTDQFHADVKRMVTPSVRLHFIPNLSENDIVRLIETIGRR
jgi:hypothetical protein